jgi:hypothetical protein
MLPVPFHYLVVPSKLGIEIGKIVPGKFAPDWSRYMAKGCKIYRPNDEPIDQGAHKRADQDALDESCRCTRASDGIWLGRGIHDSESDEVNGSSGLFSARCCPLCRQAEARLGSRTEMMRGDRFTDTNW